jgi:hypothetical protein
MSLVIDAVKRAAAGPGTDRHTRVVLASQLVTAGLHQSQIAPICTAPRLPRLDRRPPRLGG